MVSAVSRETLGHKQKMIPLVLSDVGRHQKYNIRPLFSLSLFKERVENTALEIQTGTDYLILRATLKLDSMDLCRLF